MDDFFAATGFDEVVGEQADAVLTVSDDVDLLPSRCRRDKRVENPGQHLIECAGFAGIVVESVGPKPMFGSCSAEKTGTHSV